MGGPGSGSGAASHVTPSHPLLMARQAGNEGTASRTGSRVLTNRARGNGIRIHLNSRAGAPAGSAILQNLIGNPQELINQGLRRGTPVLVDFGFALLDQLGLDNDMAEMENGGMLGGVGRAALSTIPSALVRWNEECRVIDGDSIHDCVTALKPQILETVEKDREDEIAERKAKKKKQQEEEEAKEKKKKEAEEMMNPPTTVSKTSTSVSVTDGSDMPVELQATITPITSGTQQITEQVVFTTPAEPIQAVITPVSSVAASTTAATSTASTSSATITPMPSFANSSQQQSISETAQQLAEDLAAAISSQVSRFPGLPSITSTAPSATSTPAPANISSFFSTTPTVSTNPASNASDQLPAALAPLSPSPEESRESRRLDGQDEDVTMADLNSSIESAQQRDSLAPPGVSTASSGPTSFDAAQGTSTPTEPSTARVDISEPIPEAGPSGASSSNAGGAAAASDGPDYSAILGIDVTELPEGVDPSFLVALPEEMRREVIEEQRRLQTIRQRAAQAPTAGMEEINPEILAALPPNIQEEVLAQQRIEQQRQAAVNSNPEAPVDPGEFLSNLPTSLRQSVLAELDDSEIPALPAELAAEAQNLRREYDLRNHRAMMHDRFFSHVGHSGSSALSSILRNTVGRLGTNYHVISGLDSGSRGGWRYARSGGQFPQSLLTPSSLRFKGRQLLDQEGLSCLLILLFIDDSKINTTRLHRILKYLCYHGPTRDWVVASLLSILEKSNEGKMIEHNQSVAVGFETPPAKMRKSTSKTSALIDSNSSSHSSRDKAPAWLNISMDAALGFRANVFQVQRVGGKRSVSNNSEKANSISIHPGASSIVCRHTLEVLISLAKSFPGHFLPWRDTSETAKKEESQINISKGKGKGEGKRGESGSSADFWETLLKLDLQSSSRKGKSVVRSHSNVSSFKTDDDDSSVVPFDMSPFGQLLSMLASPVVRRSSLLTDKLLRLLSLISVGQPDFMKKDRKDENEKGPVYETIKASHLKLAVEVLTSKSCSEEGLEDVNALLLNLSYGPEPTRDTILKLLLQGAQELGKVVRQNIIDLKVELKKLKENNPNATEEEDQSDVQKEKGALTDRFTKAKVVLHAPSKVKGGSELQLPSMNALTNKTSSQAFFLRVLKVIIQLRESALLAMKKNKAKQKEAAEKQAEAEKNKTESADKTSESMDVDSEAPAKTEAEKTKSEEPSSPDTLDSLSEQLKLEALWETLSACLKDLADSPDHYAVLVLQATVEAFFLVHAAATQPEDKKKVQQRETRQEQLAHIQEQLEPPLFDSQSSQEQSTSAGPSSLSTQHSVTNISKDTEKFLVFAETHRTVLNQILRQSTTHLADGPFSVLVDHTRVLDFDIKRRYFRTELERMDEGVRKEDLAVHVRRENVFEDSFRELHRRQPDEWKNRFYIVFEGEEGQDAGGLLREWYVIISREIFNPMYALFKTSPGDKVTYMIYEQSQTNPNHLDYFKFVGRVIAKAIYDNKLLECYFTRSFYKHILAKQVKYTDMESEDYTFYKGLEFLIENNVEDLGYDLTFSTEVREFGHTEVRDLIPNGRNIKVTEETKVEYVRLVCQMKMTGAVRKQLSAFLEGFYQIIPRRLISIFNEQELELLLSGLPSIDVDDLKANSEYHKYQANSLQIVWFWRALRSFDQTDQAKFMQFVTGSSKVPLQGFGALEGMNGPQKFQIHRDDRSTDRLPSAHTCFNQLDLPAYETYDKLRTYLLKAVQECSEGFGFA